jgi:hypothetical protein
MISYNPRTIKTRKHFNNGRKGYPLERRRALGDGYILRRPRPTYSWRVRARVDSAEETLVTAVPLKKEMF